jgi:glyoxylate reductase
MPSSIQQRVAFARSWRRDTTAMGADSGRMRVYATRVLPGELFSQLGRRVALEHWPGPGAPPPEELRRQAARCDGLLCMLTDRIDRPLLEAAPKLRVVSSMSVGVDHIDVKAASELGIAVGNTAGVLAETTADLAFGLLLAAARRIPEADRFVRQGAWTPERAWAPDLLVGRDVHGATLGILGLGAIGRAVARRAGGFGMRVLGWSRSGRAVPGVERVDLPALLAEADFVSIHVARTPETLALLSAPQIAAMKRGAILVNTARGGIVDEVALAAALASGHLGGAALDVYDQEPLAPDSPLLDAPGLVLAPHIGSASAATRTRMAALAVANLEAGLAGLPLPSAVTPTPGAGSSAARQEGLR